MERFFEITNTPYGDAWRRYIKINDHIRSLIPDFLKEIGLETTTYHMEQQRLYIKPTKKDVENHNDILCRAHKCDQGFQKFNENGDAGIKWNQLLRDTDALPHHYKPFSQKYLPEIFTTQTLPIYTDKMIISDNRLFLKVDGDLNNLPTNSDQNYIEISGSEYHQWKEKRK